MECKTTFNCKRLSNKHISVANILLLCCEFGVRFCIILLFAKFVEVYTHEMASSNAEGNNLMDEFEDAFQACLLSLTKQEPNTGTNKEEIELEVQKTTNRFIDVARQMEAFFLQKRFLVSTLKPYMLIKDENQDLETEIKRKENLLNKHYNRLEEWKACLADMQQTQGGHNRPVGIPLPSGIAVPTGGLLPSRTAGVIPNMPQQMQAMGPGGPIQQNQQHILQTQKIQQFRAISKMPK